MTLHIFNASHDEALAAGYPYYYPSTVARRYEADLAVLPALWAEPGDAVWVPAEALSPAVSASSDAASRFAQPDVARCGACSASSDAVSRFASSSLPPAVRLVQSSEMNAAFWADVTHIAPWGWDLLVRQRLRKVGAPAHLLPDDALIERLKQLSSRRTTARALPLLRAILEKAGVPCVGRSQVVTDADCAFDLLREWGGAMVKSLWSCSGRGVFRVGTVPTASDAGRLKRLLREQGAVEMEPVQTVLLDFALEFCLTPEGEATYLGTSLFATNAGGVYAGNLLAPQAELKRRVSQVLGGEVRFDAAVEACKQCLPTLIGTDYAGPLGVDMLVAATPQGPALLPCVEINLRRTMGHVALNVSRLASSCEELPAWLKAFHYLWH